MTWTEVPAPDGRRCWVGAWTDEGCVVIEHNPEWCQPWVATDLVTPYAGHGTTAREALDAIGCDLPAPQWRARCGDTEARNPAADAEDSERLVEQHIRDHAPKRTVRRMEPGDRPVMAWWQTEHGCVYRDPIFGGQDFVAGSDPHPTALAKALGWRAVVVPGQPDTETARHPAPAPAHWMPKGER